MTIEVVRSGAVVLGICNLRLDGICQYPDTVGPIFCYDVGEHELMNVCKSCADYKYGSGEWILPGAHNDEQTLSLQKYLLEMKASRSAKAKLEIAQRYTEKRWAVRIPISAGDYQDPFWVTDVHFSQFGWVRVALDGEDIATPAVIMMRPVRSQEELDKTEGAILFQERRIQ